jgi:hypothetical protein
MPVLEDPKLFTMMSMLDTQEACLSNGIKIEFGFVTGSAVHQARSLLANVFVQHKREFNRLFWIDADVKWRPLDFIKVLTGTLKHDVVCGVYPRRREPPGYFINFVGSTEPDEDGLVEIEATGIGFTCITRRAMEHLSAIAPKLRHGTDMEPFPALFRMDDDCESVRTEDYAFFADCRENGYRVYADCTVNVGHIGTKVYECPAHSWSNYPTRLEPKQGGQP